MFLAIKIKGNILITVDDIISVDIIQINDLYDYSEYFVSEGYSYNTKNVLQFNMLHRGGGHYYNRVKNDVIIYMRNKTINDLIL